MPTSNHKSPVPSGGRFGRIQRSPFRGAAQCASLAFSDAISPSWEFPLVPQVLWEGVAPRFTTPEHSQCLILWMVTTVAATAATTRSLAVRTHSLLRNQEPIAQVNVLLPAIY